MKFIKYCLFFSFMIYIFQGPLAKYQKKNIYIGNMKENSKRNLEEENEYDTYMILYFKEDCNYSYGFQNSFRNNINYIINRNNNAKYQNEDFLIINKGFGIELHFNKKVNDLSYFFCDSYDDNMKYLESIDLSKFDTSLVIDMQSMFKGCSSLKSIDFSNFNASLVNNMRSMFYGCRSLKSIDLSHFDTSLVTDISYMFYECELLESSYLSN